MNKFEVSQLLLDHHDRHGTEMPVIELIKLCGDTDVTQLMEGHRIYQFALGKRKEKRTA